jgi:hypothetical protein
MEMFLMILFMSLPVLVIACLAAYGIKPVSAEETSKVEARAQEELRTPSAPIPAPRFFASAPSARIGDSRVPLEVLRRQIEAHIRLEQAAAESFRDVPTRETLHSRTVSPFMN